LISTSIPVLSNSLVILDSVFHATALESELQDHHDDCELVVVAEELTLEGDPISFAVLSRTNPHKLPLSILPVGRQSNAIRVT
jgi:hypothetical protein